MWAEPNWANLSISETNEYDTLAIDLGTGLGIPRKPYQTGNVADFFDKYTNDTDEWTDHDTEGVRDAAMYEIAWRDGKGAEHTARVTGYVKRMSFVKTIVVNEAAFLHDPKQVSMGEYKARARRKRELDTKLHGYVPGFRFVRHEPSPFGAPETRFRKFNPLSAFDDKDRHGFVHIHVWR